jgi:hypothetical protein
VKGDSGAVLEVLKLFAESGNWIKRLLVVNGSSEAAVACAQRIASVFQESDVRTEWVAAGGFTDLVTSGDLQCWMTAAESS